MINTKTRLWIVTLAVAVLAMALLACGPLGGAGQEEPAPTPVVSQPTEAPAAATPTEAPAPPKPAGVKLTAEYRSAAGGYSFSYPEGWAHLGLGPMVVVAEGDEALGAEGGSEPVVLFSVESIADLAEEAGVDESELTDPAQLLDVEEEEDVELSEVKSLTLDGYPAASAVAKGKMDEDQWVVARVVSVLLEDRGLRVVALSPLDRWDEMEPIFDAMINSLSFFPPEEGAAEIPSLAEETPSVPEETPPAPAEAPQATEEGQVSYDTVFPLPDDVQNFMGEGGENQVNFQTSLSLDEVIEFYRQAFADQGLTERTLLTTITDTAFSMVFDGWPNGKALVIQGVDLGTNTNVNIRFEDV